MLFAHIRYGYAIASMQLRNILKQAYMDGTYFASGQSAAGERTIDKLMCRWPVPVIDQLPINAIAW
jgi:hypothetical protein